MKRRCWGLAATILCLALSLSACRMPPEEIPNFLDGVATGLGNSQITMDMELIGERTGGTDAYTGTYRSDCAGDTGRDVVFRAISEWFYKGPGSCICTALSAPRRETRWSSSAKMKT